ncbi:MAG: ATP-binding cassette domain-containing protein, partial [Planctomycetaceae bacterium]
MCSTTLISSVLIWSMLVNTLEGGFAVWLFAGWRNIAELVSAVPQTLLFGAWSAGMLVFLHRTGTSGMTPEHSDTTNTVEDGAIATDDAVTKSENLQRQLERIAAQQLRTSPDNLLDSPLLEVDHIQVEFDGFRALDIDSFQIGHYSLNVIIGPNGAGKTTLCDVISGKTRPTSGRVRFVGQDITKLRDVDIARMGVGRKFQTPTVFDSLSVYQ